MPAKKETPPTKGEATRAMIEDAAIALFMEHGYHATSMRQIAERAELALGGIYNHFSSKEEIFEAIIVDKHPYQRVLPLILEAQGETAEDFLRSATQIAIAEMKSQPYYLKLMLIEIAEFNGAHGAKMIKKVAPQILPVFEKAIKTRKELRTANPIILMRSFIGFVISYLMTEIVISNSMLKHISPKNSMEVYIDIYLHGVLKSEN